jgi:gliding motility-associated-like protein
MKRLLFLLGLLTSFAASATHNIAGEITVACVNGGYIATVTTYTNSLSPADRCDLLIEWGDSFSETLYRVDGPSGSCPPPATMGSPLGTQYPNTQVNVYRNSSPHFYPGPGTYRIRIKDPNRVAGIVNIPNSVNVPFYLQTTITVDPNIGCNSTPYLTTIPLDKACLGHCYYHNPGAVDPDGDSLSYRLGPCLDTTGNPIAGYQLPNIAGGGVMNIDPVTGDLSWCSPMDGGKYNVVIYIDEWKKLFNGPYVLVGTVLRDMSIDVIDECNNDNPDIPDLPDLCVDAGTSVSFSFTITDPNNGDRVYLSESGTPFNVIPAADASPDSAYLTAPYNVNFNWQTNCERVRRQPYIVTFKAVDDDPQVPLLDIESMQITVVSPGPQFLNALPQGTTMQLNWGINPCNPTNNFVVGYKIYRRSGPSGWNPAQCETGVPAYTGFQLIGTVSGYNTTSYIDDDNGAGLIPGVEYCYRVHAYFLDAAESYASPEACNQLKRDVPVITNVDIQSTGNADTVNVAWANALANGIDFDTLLHPGPYILTLERAVGYTFVSPVIVTSFTVANFYQLPTTYQDLLLNTVGTPYTYRLSFAAMNGADVLGNSQPASSTFLTASPADNRVVLTWADTVPWVNYEYAVFRFNTVSLLWDSIGLSLNNTYTDTGLINGVEYCYFVKAHGSYFNITLPPLLLNRSQRVCATPVDLTPPCPPILAINSDCFIAQNQLIWTNPNNMNCGTDDVVSYHIWYAPTPNDPYTLIQTVNLATDTQLVFSNLLSVAGCYAVTALDTFNNESAYSNIICLDNCPYYELPNVFTPNGDETNDLFIPFPYRYIQSIDLKIYDRWGVLVFETTDPDVRWNGRDKNTGRLCTDGVYYYVCTVNEIHLEGIVPRNIKGFVHLFGKPSGLSD